MKSPDANVSGPVRNDSEQEKARQPGETGIHPPRCRTCGRLLPDWGPCQLMFFDEDEGEWRHE